MIDLRRLQALRAVHHYGTVTAAAHALHLTPSAASRQLAQLARELGVALLEHQGRRVVLTPAAHTLLTHADAIHSRWEQAQADLVSGPDGGLLRLSGFPSAVYALLAPTAARLRRRHPHLTVHITEAETAACFGLVFSGDADLAVAVATPDMPPRGDTKFDQQVLLNEPFDLLVSAGHHLAGSSAVTLDQTASEPWIVGAPGTTYTTLVLASCATAGFAPEIAHRAEDWSAASALVAEGLGVALIPRLGHIPPEHRNTRIPLHGETTPSRRILTCTRRGGQRQAGIAQALATLHEMATTHTS